MAWFSKKEEVPKLEASSDIDGPLDDIDGHVLPELPSFPVGPSNDGFNQEIVKSAVGDELGDSESFVSADSSVSIKDSGIPSLPRSRSSSRLPGFPSTSVERFSPSLGSLEAVSPSVSVDSSSLPSMEVPSEPVSSFSPPMLSSSQVAVSEPIFVRLDKFQDSQRIFKEIRETVEEIENVLGKIKSVRSKEENELNGWTKEVESLKQKLSEIDSEIFNQI